MAETVQTITVRGTDAGDAMMQAALHLEGRALRATGEPVKTQTFVPAYGTDEQGRPRVWLWKVPVAPEED